MSGSQRRVEIFVSCRRDLAYLLTGRRIEHTEHAPGTGTPLAANEELRRGAMVREHGLPYLDALASRVVDVLIAGIRVPSAYERGLSRAWGPV
jgi:hypothetical protein